MLREACGSASHPSYLERRRARIATARRSGAPTSTLLRDLLEPLGIAVLDASHPSVCRAASAAARARRARLPAHVAAAVHRRGEEIVARGFHPQVEEVEGLSLVFSNSGGTKRACRLPRPRRSRASGDEFLSPTVLLRPVIERAILPTAAYLGGPGEVAYFAQVNAVARRSGVPTPLVLPRWSATIVEPRIARILEEFAAGVDDLADPHALETRVARERLSDRDRAGAARVAQRSRRRHRRAASRERRRRVAMRCSTDCAATIEHRLDRLERRFAAGVKRAETEAMRRIATARASLFPHGARQERRLSYVVFLARYGPKR